MPTARVDELLRALVVPPWHLPRGRRIDLLKVDFDTPWRDGKASAASAGLTTLITERAFGNRMPRGSNPSLASPTDAP